MEVSFTHNFYHTNDFINLNKAVLVTFTPRISVHYGDRVTQRDVKVLRTSFGWSMGVCGCQKINSLRMERRRNHELL